MAVSVSVSPCLCGCMSFCVGVCACVWVCARARACVRGCVRVSGCVFSVSVVNRYICVSVASLLCLCYVFAVSLSYLGAFPPACLPGAEALAAGLAAALPLGTLPGTAAGGIAGLATSGAVQTSAVRISAGGAGDGPPEVEHPNEQPNPLFTMPPHVVCKEKHLKDI